MCFYYDDKQIPEVSIFVTMWCVFMCACVIAHCMELTFCTAFYSVALFCTKFMATQKRRSFGDIFSEFISTLVSELEHNGAFVLSKAFVFVFRGYFILCVILYLRTLLERFICLHRYQGHSRDIWNPSNLLWNILFNCVTSKTGLRFCSVLKRKI